jgi:hypothetical protein
MKLRSIVFGAALGFGALACEDSGSGAGGAGGAGGGDLGGAGGASSPQAVEDAIDLCYEALQGDVSKRQAGLDALEQATLDYPEEGRAFLFLGMCSLAAVAEDGLVDAFFQIEPALERAIELLPDDHRIPGWLATVRVQGAIVFDDPAALEAAIQEMIAAADLYPEFNNLSLALAFSQLPLDTPYPQMAVDRMEAIRDCGETDERCRDNEAAPHNVPTSVMLFGDLYARIGDEETARAYYEQAFVQESAATWPYLADAQAMLDELPSRVAAWTDADPENDPAFFISGVRTCRSCHE